MPVWYDSDGDGGDSSRAAARSRGWTIPSFPALHQAIRGTAPSGPKWDAFRTIHNVNSTLQRLVALPPGSSPRPPRRCGPRLRGSTRTRSSRPTSIRPCEFAADYETGPDIAARVRALLVASPEVRAFVADYIKSAQKK